MSRQIIVVESAVTSSDKDQRRKTPFVIAGIALAALATVVGSVFAANIGLNGGTDIEFGQGSQQAVVCDDSVTVSPFAGYDASAGMWGLMINLVDIDATACFGKTFTVSSWNGSGTLNDEWVFTLDNVDSDSGAGWMVAPGNSAWRYFSDGSTYSVSVVSTMDPRNLETVTVETSN